MKKALKAAGLIAAAVVLGLLTAQGSYALWNTTAPANAGIVQAANFSILVNNAEMGSTPIALSIGELAPGKSAYTSLTVTNNVNVTAASPLVLQPSLTGLAPVDNFGGNLTVTTAVATAGKACKDLAPTDWKTVPALQSMGVGASQTICIKVELNTNTPASHLGKSINIPVTLTVAQVAPAAK